MHPTIHDGGSGPGGEILPYVEKPRLLRLIPPGLMPERREDREGDLVALRARRPVRAALLALIGHAALDLGTAREQPEAFHAMVRERRPDALAPWIAAAQGGPLASFAAGLKADRPAVEATMRDVWSSGLVEGRIDRRKLLTRQTQSRAKADLLEARLVQAA